MFLLSAIGPDCARAEGEIAGWIFHRTGVFDSPTTDSTDATALLELQATNNTNCFGYWESPPYGLAGGGYSQALRPARWTARAAADSPDEPADLYVARYLVSTSVREGGRVPQLRLRASFPTLQQSLFFVADSRQNGAASPRTRPTPLELIFAPPPGAPVVQLAFDLLNFNPDDDPRGDLKLHSLELIRHDPDVVTSVTLLRHYAFTPESPTQGWTSHTAPPFLPPRFEAPGQGLGIAPQAPASAAPESFSFGYWNSPPGEVVLDPASLYLITFDVQSDLPADEVLRLPGFRLRVNDETLHWGAGISVESRGDPAQLPAADRPKSYTLYFRPPAVAAGNSLIASFDLLYLDPDDLPTGTLWLRAVLIKRLPDPFPIPGQDR